MKEEKLSYGQHLFSCGDNIEKVYVVVEGSFKLCKRINRRSLAGIRHKESEYKRRIEDEKNG